MPDSTTEDMTTHAARSGAARVAAAAVLTVGALLVAVVFAEVALRLLVKPPGTYSMLLPGTRIFEPDRRYVSGVVGTARYEVNADGYRGRPFGPDAEEYRILLIGGSTTECTLLDVSEHWGTIVEQTLE